MRTAEAASMSTDHHDDGLDVLRGTVDGREVLWFSRAIRDDLPAVVREGLARRRITITLGGCPCGARPQLVTRTERPSRPRAGRRRGKRRQANPERVTYVAVHHADTCPAIDPRVIEYLRAWRPAA